MFPISYGIYASSDKSPKGKKDKGNQKGNNKNITSNSDFYIGEFSTTKHY